MKPKEFELQEVVVKASPFTKTEESPLSLRTLQISEIEKNPGGNRDISRVIQILPGVFRRFGWNYQCRFRQGS
jgi:hypothetical protein